MLESGGRSTQVTLTFNAATGAVKPLRSKEDSQDYRYFPDPDLPPVVLDAAWIASLRDSLVELPGSRRERYQRGLRPHAVRRARADAGTGGRGVLRIAGGTGVPAKSAANWVMGEVLSGWNESGIFAVEPQRLASLIALVSDGTLSLQAAKRVYIDLATSGDEPLATAERLGLLQVRDTNSLSGWVDEVLAEHPDEVGRFRAGETKLIGFFVGQVMKRSGGKADPKAIQPVLRERLDR